LLRQDPENRTVAKRFASFYAVWLGSLTVPDPALLDLVRTAADPAGLARTFLEPVVVGSHPLQTRIALAALSARPSDAGLWDLTAEIAPDVSWKIAFQEEAFRVGLAATSGDTPALAARWIGRLLENGFLHRALAADRGLPPAIRVSLQNDSVHPAHRDLRLELAAAAFLDGDRETAGQLLHAAYGRPAVRLRGLIERALSTPANLTDDGFDVLTEPGEDVVSTLLIARLAEREAYPALAAYDLHGIAAYVLGDRRHSFEPEADVPARLRTIREEIDAERESLQRTLEDQARAAEAAASTALGPDPAAPVIARLLAEMAAPAAPVFKERPLPDGIRPLRLSDEQIEARLGKEAQGIHLPSSLNAVRIERQGPRIAVIVQSQDLDPVGEISAGAYWVLLSEDRGATWGPLLYTGLRINQPYVVRPVSALPLFNGDRLRLEMEIRELDPSRISFPPISLPVKRSAEGVFLEIPIATLTRDSDEDGLTDLVEARLLTDPRLADSDGDGLKDGDDPLPGVPQTTDTSPAAEVLAAVVKQIAGVGRRALIEGVDGTPTGVACCGPRQGPPLIEPTVFFLGERPLFAGLRPDRRIIVLTRAEAEAVEKTFGPFYPLDLDLFLFDHSGRRALVIWSATWQGGTLSLEEKDGQWIVTEVSSSIT